MGQDTSEGLEAVPTPFDAGEENAQNRKKIFIGERRKDTAVCFLQEQGINFTSHRVESRISTWTPAAVAALSPSLHCTWVTPFNVENIYVYLRGRTELVWAPESIGIRARLFNSVKSPLAPEAN